MEPFDIVKLIEKNPITRMNNKNYESKLVQKLKNTFSNDEQKLFLSSFYCFLNHKDNEFVVDFDNIWKWCGFSRKGHAKTLLEKHFQKDIDYIISTSITDDDTKMSEEKFASANAEANFSSNTQENECEIVDLELTDKYKNLINLQKKELIEICKNKKLKTSGTKADIVTRILNNNNNNNKNSGGQNKETIMLKITTFKKFCMKANTKKADEVHDYYIKLEKILHDIILEQSDELSIQLGLKNNEIKKLEETVYSEQCLNIKHQKSLLYQQEKVTNRYKLSKQGCVYIVHDPVWKFTKYKIGITDDFNERISTYRTSSIDMKVDFILYTPHFELFEKVIKIKFCEYVEQPSHEIYVTDLDILIDGIKDMNRVCEFNGYEEKELWKINLEQPPTPEHVPESTKQTYTTVKHIKEKVINEYIMPVAMKDDWSKKYIDVDVPDNEDLKDFNPVSDVSRFNEISSSSFLPSRILFSEYKLKNKNAPEGKRYCNSFCQNYCNIDEFQYKSQYLFTLCKNCRIMEDLARYKIQNNIYTCVQIAKNPSLVFLDTNQKLCPYCKEIKHESKFRLNRRQCNVCKDSKRSNKIKTMRQNIYDEIDNIKNKIKDIQNKDELVNIFDKYNRDIIYSVCIHLDIKRRSTDSKLTMIEKLIEKI
jgi:hypothetical protein